MKASWLGLETVLITRRTVVRRFREQEGQALYDLVDANSTILQDLIPEILPQINDPLEAEFFVRQKLAAWLKQESLHFAIWDKDSARMIGYIGLDPIDWRLPKAGMKGFIDKSLNNNGLMTEVLQALFLFAFRKAELEKLTLEISTENVAAQRLARKCGLQREGDLREEYRRIGGEPVDTLLLALTRNAYEKV